jgi:predicted metal-dependent hydrolase
MPKVQYGATEIEFAIEEKDNLSSHYISVDKEQGVILKGEAISEALAQKMILKKAKWILQKLEQVKSKEEGEIVTGSRIPYLGKKYYAQVLLSEATKSATIEFNYSQFKISINLNDETQQEIQKALTAFYKRKAKEKILPRIKKWSAKTGLKYEKVKFRILERWGSCTAKDHLIFNINIMKLPLSLIDYIIVHELCHTKVKSHGKEFWEELGRHMDGWKELDERMRKVSF